MENTLVNYANYQEYFGIQECQLDELTPNELDAMVDSFDKLTPNSRSQLTDRLVSVLQNKTR